LTSSTGRGVGAGGSLPGMTGVPEIALKMAAKRSSVGSDEKSSSAVANYAQKTNICTK